MCNYLQLFSSFTFIIFLVLVIFHKVGDCLFQGASSSLGLALPASI